MTRVNERKFTPEERAQIAQWWADGVQQREIRKRMECGIEAIRRVFDTLPPRPKARKHFSPTPAKVIDEESLAVMYRNNTPMDEISRRLGVSTALIYRRIKALGLGGYRGRGVDPSITQETKDAIIADVIGTSRVLVDIARDHGVTRTMLLRICKEAGVSRDKRAAQYARESAAREAERRAKSYLIKGTKLDRCPPTDPYVATLMRFFVPVCRLQVIDKKAPPDMWQVGQKRMHESEMRALAEAKGAEARW